jgi:integrase
MSKTATKPDKPREDFPLFPHATGRWAKKVRGKLHYFGPWSDPQAALEKWLNERDDLLAGRKPRGARQGLTVLDLCNRFLFAKEHLVNAGELQQRTWDDYKAAADRIRKTFGEGRLVEDLQADDFDVLRAKLAKNRGPIPLGNEIQRVRSIFKYAFDASLIDKPVRFGPSFKKPSRKSVRHARHARGLQMFEAAEIRALLAKAGVQLKAMLLLGVNCGFGNNDVGTLPIAAVDLSRGWINYPRPKTGIARRCPLWPETVKALKAAFAKRPAPKDEAHEGLFFVTKYGKPWAKSKVDNPVTKETRKLIDDVGIERPGLGFYGLRRAFETVSGESLDQVAVDHVMGHSPPDSDMSAVYRQRITDDRLLAVTEHVRKWLFPKSKKSR